MAQNGHEGRHLSEAETDVVGEIRALAGRIPTSLTAPLERVASREPAFEQKAHTLMLESIDKISQQWVDELGHVRENTQTVEQMVLSQAAKVKEEITKLHLLGMQAMKEAQRGHEVTQHLGEQLETMMAEQHGNQ